MLKPKIIHRPVMMQSIGGTLFVYETFCGLTGPNKYVSQVTSEITCKACLRSAKVY